MDLNKLTVQELEEKLQELKEDSNDVARIHPWRIGKNYLIRTVTMIMTGRLTAVFDGELLLEDAAWIADTGRFMQATETGEFNEVEPWKTKEVIVGRGSIIDAGIISFDLPKKQK